MNSLPGVFVSSGTHCQVGLCHQGLVARCVCIIVDVVLGEFVLSMGLVSG